MNQSDDDPRLKNEFEMVCHFYPDQNLKYVQF